HLASTTDMGVTPIANSSLPHLLPAINHYKFTTLRIAARRKLGYNIQSSGRSFCGTIALLGLYYHKCQVMRGEIATGNVLHVL
ncbi:Bgt-20487, partial [Blumeria graminis f. sp. tritici]